MGGRANLTRLPQLPRMAHLAHLPRRGCAKFLQEGTGVNGEEREVRPPRRGDSRTAEDAKYAEGN